MIAWLRYHGLRLRSSAFVINVAIVGGGVAVGQAISLAFTPILTRLYGPAAFGMAAAFAAVLSLITPLATLGFANAIVMPESDEEAIAVVRLSLLCALAFTMATLLIVHLGAPWLAQWAGLRGAGWVFYLIPPSLLAFAVLTITNQVAIRQGLYQAKARAYAESTLLTHLAKLAGGLLAPSGLLLILVTLAGHAVNVQIQFLRVPQRGLWRVTNWLSMRGVRQAAQTQRDFALFRMPQSILYSAAVGMPILMLTFFFGSGAAGQYSLAAAVMAAPVVLFGQAVEEVFYPAITRSINSRSSEAYGQLARVSFGLALVAIAPFGLTMAWGDRFFPLIFGSEWGLAGEYSRWMSVWLISTMANRACVSALPVLRLQGFLLGREVVSVLLRAGALYAGYALFRSDIAAVALFSLAGVIIDVSLVLVTFQRLGRYSREWAAARNVPLESKF